MSKEIIVFEKESDLVKQTAKEKVLALIHTREQIRILANQKKEEMALKKQELKMDNSFSNLFTSLVKKYLPITNSDLKKCEEEEFMYLNNLLSQKISLWHKIHLAFYGFWSLALIPAHKLQEKSHSLGILAGMATLGVTIIGMPTLAALLTHSDLIGFLLGTTMMSSIVGLTQHFGDIDKLEACHTCHYLGLSKSLKNNRGPNYFPVKEVQKMLTVKK